MATTTLSHSYVDTFVQSNGLASRIMRLQALSLTNTFVRRSPEILRNAENLAKQVRLAVWQAAESESRGHREERNKLLWMGYDLTLQLQDMEHEAERIAETQQKPRISESERRARQLLRSQAGPKGRIESAPTKFGNGKKKGK